MSNNVIVMLRVQKTAVLPLLSIVLVALARISVFLLTRSTA